MEVPENVREHPHYPGYYVSPYGDVYSTRQTILRKMKPSIGRDGFVRYVLCINGKRKCISCQKLVSEVYLPNPNQWKCVRHRDKNKLNNHYSNLEWYDRDERMHDSKRKVWKVINLEKNEEFIVSNLLAFCKSRDLSIDCLRKTHTNGKRNLINSHRNYRLFEHNDTYANEAIPK